MTEAPGTPLVVATPAGRVRGLRTAGLTAWRGIPYAAAPIGERRFRAPEPPEPWAGVRDATRDGPMPPQPRATRVTGAGLRTPMSEDCLTVSVVRRTGGRARKPVMVFVYGGAFGVGAVNAHAYVGEALAARGDVVFVGFNYRLGALGWLDLTAYGTAERPIDGNLGLRDQLAALAWVRDSIAAFGGDPDNVTCFGESAGGTSVLTLLAVPAARGLFARAIVESATIGTVVGRARSQRWAAELVADLVGEHGRRADLVGEHGRRADLVGEHGRRADLVGERDGDPTLLDPARTGAALRAASTGELIAATNRLDLRVSDEEPGARVLGPVVDGGLLPAHPLDALRAGDALPVPLLIGTNADDGSLFQLFPGLKATPARLERMFTRTVPEAREPILAEYPDSRRRRFGRFVTDLMFWHPSVLAAEGHARVAPVWMYRFDFAPRALRWSGLGAMHGAELDHAFGRIGSPLFRVSTALGGRRAGRALMRRVHARWVAFAEDGRVGADWPPFDPEHRRTLVLDAADRVEEDPGAAARAAWSRWRTYPDR